MKKLPVLLAACVLGVWGCASGSRARADKLDSAYQDLPTEKDVAQNDRLDAPTVYDGEATGGAGYTVTTGDGQIWVPEMAPGNTVTRTPSDTQRGLEREHIQSEVTDEGHTDKAPRR